MEYKWSWLSTVPVEIEIRAVWQRQILTRKVPSPFFSWQLNRFFQCPFSSFPSLALFCLCLPSGHLFVLIQNREDGEKGIKETKEEARERKANTWSKAEKEKDLRRMGNEKGREEDVAVHFEMDFHSCSSRDMGNTYNCFVNTFPYWSMFLWMWQCTWEIM